MAKHVGVQLPDDLLAMLRAGGTIGILATFSEKGVPNTMPVQWLCAKGSESLLMTIHKEHTSYHNMVWQKKIMLCFLGAENITYSVLGRAGVVRAPSLVNPLMNVIRIDIVEVKSDRSLLVSVDAGIQWSYTSPDAQELGKALMEELEDLAGML
jgi:flavin reductase (DIM6/NTAB) family NADH-FMN oxidoreductase RutF